MKQTIGIVLLLVATSLALVAQDKPDIEKEEAKTGDEADEKVKLFNRT